jgi:beta-glucosidase
LRGFEIAVRESDPVAVMTAYNRINGTPGSSNPLLLTSILREEWGFNGMVVSDWGAVNDPVAAVRAGMDLEMPANPLTPGRLEAAISEGRLPPEELDRAVGNVLGLVNLQDRLLQGVTLPGLYNGHEVAEAAALESIVLLENRGALPLDQRRHNRIGVVGRLAVDPRIQGIGSSQMSPTQIDTIWSAIREEGQRKGFDIQGWFPDYSEDGLSPQEQADLRSFVGELDLVIAVVGQKASHDAEAWDRPSAELAEGDRDIVGIALSAGKPVVSVVVGGGAVDVAPLADTDALLFGWLGGQGFGSALAKILYGEAGPSGRLSETFAHSVSDHASSMNFPGGPWSVVYGEGLFVGYRYFQSFDQPVAYPFGHGLSYTTFAYLGAEAPETIDDPNRPFEVVVSVRNTGEETGSEVVQVYLHQEDPSLVRPDLELAGFTKVSLNPGEEKKVGVSIDPARLSYFDPDRQSWVTEDGEYELRIGASSADIRITRPFTVAVGTMPRPVYTLDHSLGDLYDDERGRAVVDIITSWWGRESLSVASPDDFRAAIIRDLPFRKISNFSEGRLSLEHLSGILDLVNSDLGVSEIERIISDRFGGGG